MSLHIYSSPDTLAEGLATWMAGNINLVLKQKERYSFVLSGGGTPKKLYQLLAAEFAEVVDWQRVDFFWGDERYVPFNDERNNARMAYEYLLTPLKVPEKNVHIMQTGPSPEEAAEQYSHTLKNYFANEDNYSFDFTLLGMGTDGHTLSLFPGSGLLGNHSDWVKNVLNEKEGLQRITLMPVLVNRSRNIGFLAQGTDKATTLSEVFSGKHDPAKYPSQLIKSRKDGKLMWFVDRDAVSNMSL